MEPVNEDMPDAIDEVLAELQDTQEYEPTVEDLLDKMDMDELLRLLASQQYYEPEEEDGYYNNRVY